MAWCPKSHARFCTCYTCEGLPNAASSLIILYIWYYFCLIMLCKSVRFQYRSQLKTSLQNEHEVMCLLLLKNGMWLKSLWGLSHLQGDRIHWCPHSHSLSGPHTCRCWGWSLDYTHNPPHTHPDSRAVQPHPDTSLDTNSHTESRSCWEDRPGLHRGTEGWMNGLGRGGRKEGRVETRINKRRSRTWMKRRMLGCG